MTTVFSRYGRVRAESVVLAINAWCTSSLQLRSHLVMTASDNVVVRPRAAAVKCTTHQRVRRWPPARLLATRWRMGNFSSARQASGSAGVRAGRARCLAQPPTPGTPAVQQIAADTFPMLPMPRCVSSWRAPVEYSLSSLPFFGELSGHPRCLLRHWLFRRRNRPVGARCAHPRESGNRRQGWSLYFLPDPSTVTKLAAAGAHSIPRRAASQVGDAQARIASRTRSGGSAWPPVF